MRADSQSRSQQEARTSGVSVTRVVLVGLIGSLAGTAVMDLVMVVQFAIVGLPASTYLALIGSILGGGVPLGVVLHILMGSFGLGHNLTQMGYLRPRNRHDRYRNLYLVGASTHPGSGLPSALISARFVTERVLQTAGLPEVARP